MKISTLLALTPLSFLALAGPTPLLEQRELDITENLAAIAQGIKTAVSQGDPTGVLNALRKLSPVGSPPTSPEDAAAKLQAIFNGTAVPPATIYEYIANLRALNLIDSIDSLLDFANGVANGQDSTNNANRAPSDVIYPQKSACDVKYSVDENTLRSAIYIPSTFTYGAIPPVILFPGTGNYGYETLSGNIIPLLTGSGFADPVWVNVPGRMLDDAQKSAEFAAYTINYISSITKGKNVTVLAWSQGNIDMQWAFKYWPSTAKVTSNHIAVSPDYAGTIMANFAALPGEPLPPSVLQQEYLQSSNFITTLRSCNGDSAYVPTTTIYSGSFDEIVEPQQGTGASAFLKDVRGVGVTNNQVQLVCSGQPAGSFYTHEGVLYNPLSYFLLKDAMTNGGPGNIDRLHLPSVCATYLTPGLNLGNLLVTENAIAIAGLAILTYPKPPFTEPAISSYALSCPTSTCPISTSTSTVTATTSSSATSSTLTSLTTTTATSSTNTATGPSTTSSSSVSITTSTASTTSSVSSGWESWSPITATTSSYSEPDNSRSWTNWPSTTSPGVQVITKTWSSGTVIYTSYVTITVSSASESEWNTWIEQTSTTTTADWTIWGAGSRPTEETKTAIWNTWSDVGVNNNGAKASQSVKASDSWSNLPASPTMSGATSPAATDSSRWSVLSDYPTATGTSSNWAGWSNTNGATGVQGPAGASGTAMIAQWKGAAVKSVGHHTAMLALSIGAFVLVAM